MAMTSSAEDQAHGISFFERLDTQAEPRSVMDAPSLSDILDSIKRNLRSILNTRLGESLSAPDLGIEDLNDAALSHHDLQIAIKQSITQCILKYEPRISQVQVRGYSDAINPLHIHFQIVAVVNHGAVHERVQLELFVDKNRKYRVV